jgi:hypothetical protein
VNDCSFGHWYQWVMDLDGLFPYAAWQGVIRLMPDPSRPNAVPNSAPIAVGTALEPHSSEAEVAKTESEIEQATDGARSVPPDSAAPKPWLTGNGPVIAILAIGLPALLAFSFLAAWGIHRAGTALWRAAAAYAPNGNASAEGGPSTLGAGNVDGAMQQQAEALLARAASGDDAAARQVLALADGWTGKTRRSPRTDQTVSASINSRSPEARAAAVAAQLAFDGVPRDASGLARTEQAVGNPNQRVWALWMLGALANRGVDSIHAAKVIESYLDDPDVRTRATAVDALALVGTDETVPMLLDRFRNDPSPLVQERAACDIAEAGMYTGAQRRVAAASLVAWVDDSLLSAQQRAWAIQALADISGRNFGANSSAWKSWYAQQSASN